jgi:hypothetical protein
MNLRNKLCTCGSGIKSKRCCQSQQALNQKRAEYKAAMQAAVEKRRLERETHLREMSTTMQRRHGRTSVSYVWTLAAATAAIMPLRQNRSHP